MASATEELGHTGLRTDETAPTSTPADARALAIGPDAPAASARPMGEMGVTGLKVFSGVVQEEFLRQLQGTKAAKVYREMADNDSTVGAMLGAVELMCRAVEWTIEPVDTSKAAEDAAEFARSLTDDMSGTWEDFIAEALTMLQYGWSFFEIVYKRRIGPSEPDPTRRSKYTDGKIGVRKLAPRSQDSLLRWLMQQDGGIDGLVQLPPQGGPEVAIPIGKSLLFRTTTRKNNPEGRSILRTAYRAWYKLKLIQDAEAIGIERELAGLPVIKIPSMYFTSEAPEDQAVLRAYEKVARDLKMNEQGGLVVPSDVWADPDGKLTANPKVSFELVSSGGSRQIDTNVVCKRYQEDITRSALAEFLMMGSASGKSGAGGGGKAQHSDKTELFFRACETYLNQIAGVINRYLFPRAWDLNGMDRALMPEAKPGAIAPADLEKIGAFLQALAAAGAPVFPDDPLENHLRDLAGLPERERPSDEVIQEQADRDAETALASRPPPPQGGGAPKGGAPKAGKGGKGAVRKRGGGPVWDEAKHPRDKLGEWSEADEVAFQEEERDRKARVRTMTAFERYASADGRVTDKEVEKALFTIGASEPLLKELRAEALAAGFDPGAVDGFFGPAE